MLPLVIQIDRTSEGRTLTRAFHESPVRIGRSPFAGLRLRDPFVSEWQAVVRFHGARTTYLDLGSRNPTRIGGQEVERNVEVEVDENTEVCIGTLRLRFRRAESLQHVQESPPDHETAFLPNQLALPEQPAGTVMLERSVVLGAAPPPLPHRKTPAAALPPAPAPRSPSPQDDASLLAAHRSYREAASGLLAAVQRELEQTPSSQRASCVRSLHARYPELIQEPAFRDWAATAGVDPVQLGHIDIEHWLGRLCGVPATALPPEQSAQTMERVGQLLEIFASAFIESRRAHQRARRKLGLEKSAAPNTTLQQSEDPHALLAYLLRLGPNAQDRSHELRRSLADFAMHQIALLSAVVEGARSVLGQLEPRVLHDASEPDHGLEVLERDGALGKLWPYEARRLWRKFLVRHHDLTQTDHFTRELFGREFTRRYHAIADTATNVAHGSEAT